MTHCMGDTETLGRKPGCAILSLGAVIFDPYGKGHGDYFYRNIELTQQLFLGFHIDPETLKWWQRQSEEAKASLLEGQHKIKNVLIDFGEWCKNHQVDRFWCQGAIFDAPILEAAYEIVGLPLPWKFRDVRDTRTVYDLCGLDVKSIAPVGVHHNALDDAIFQVNCVQAALAGRK